MKLGVATLVALFVACHAPTALAPAPDASDASSAADGGVSGAVTPDCRSACDRLFALGCPAGMSPNCGVALTEMDAYRMRERPDGFPMTCTSVASAKTSAEAIAAGIPCSP